MGIRDTLSKTITHRAKKCFIHLLKKDRQSRVLNLDDVYEAVIHFDVHVMEEMKRIGFNDFKRELEHGTILHSVAREIRMNAHGSSSQIEKLEYLISQEGVTAYSVNCYGEHPVDIIASYLGSLDPTSENSDDKNRQKSVTFVNTTQVLLSAMRKERAEQELLMPRSTAMALHRQYYFLLYMRIQGSTNQQIVNLSLDLCIEILEMVLAAGVDLVNVQEEVMAATFQKGFAPKAGPLSHFQSYREMIMGVGMNSHQPLQTCAEQIVKFNTLFLAYGMNPDSECLRFLLWLLELNIPLLTTGLILPFISLMSPKDIEQFRKLAANMKNVDMTLISDKFCKSLKDTCRSVLYGSVKDRRMAVHVSSLPLPKQIKQWLCFDCDINEKNHLEFGMKNVKQQKRKAEEMESSRNGKRHKCDAAQYSDKM